MSTAALHYPTSTARSSHRAMTGLLRLAWKEYRSLRWFWLAIVVLVVLMDYLVIAFAGSWNNIASAIYNFALGAPVMFAIGAAGASFAAEKEEGTYDFLRSSPSAAWQILLSKWLVIALATIGMAALLWSMGELFVGGRVGPIQADLHNIIAFWPVAALEVLAWGTLFSLLTARPLFAVALGMLAAAAEAHLLSWTQLTNRRNVFEPEAYIHAVPLRAVVALLLLVVDAYLASRWLKRYVQKTRVEFTFKIHRAGASARVLPAKDTSAFEKQIVLAQLMLHRRSRLVMIGRLLWQHWRQSGWLMIVLPLVGLPVAAFITGVGFDWLMWRTIGESGDTSGFSVFVIILTSIAGSMVFLGDKERDRFRYFIDHNIPPRYVWLTRHLLWLIITLFIGLFVIAAGGFWRFEGSSTSGGSVNGPPPELLLAIVTAYTAGQWTSMHVRSGVLAGFFGLLLTAALSGWIYLMHWARIDSRWSVLPIPLILMFATWLRAPDWVSENKRWSARIRAAAVILVPFGALLVAVPIYRVHQVPTVIYLAKPGARVKINLPTFDVTQIDVRNPGTVVKNAPGSFDVEQFVATIRDNLKAGQETADLYRKAAGAYEYPPIMLPIKSPLTPAIAKWLEANDKSLQSALEASKRPDCFFGDPLTEMEFTPTFLHGTVLSDLIRISGRQLEEQGDLDGALDRYFAAIHTTAQLSPVTAWPQTQQALEADFAAIAAWGANDNVTAEQIQQAIDRLEALDLDYIHAADNAKITYLVARRSILAGKGNSFTGLSDLPGEVTAGARTQLEREVIWGTLMPWENHRAIRLLNLLMYSLVQRCDTVQLFLSRQKLAAPGESDCVFGLMGRPHYSLPADVPTPTRGIRRNADANSGLEVFDRIGSLIQTTLPDLQWVDNLSMFSVRAMSEFEARRRGTIIVLAIDAYRLKHGKLPNTLSDLVGGKLKRLPADPYSDYEFRYFPNGIPSSKLDSVPKSVLSSVPFDEPDLTLVAAAADQEHELDALQSAGKASPVSERYRRSGIWCSGPDLITDLHVIGNNDPRILRDGNQEDIFEYRYFERRYNVDGEDLQPTDIWWPSGFWFPIPEAPAP